MFLLLKFLRLTATIKHVVDRRVGWCLSAGAAEITMIWSTQDEVSGQEPSGSYRWRSFRIRLTAQASWFKSASLEKPASVYHRANSMDSPSKFALVFCLIYETRVTQATFAKPSSNTTVIGFNEDVHMAMQNAGTSSVTCAEQAWQKIEQLATK